MTDADGAAGRNFESLTVREAQDALAEELQHPMQDDEAAGDAAGVEEEDSPEADAGDDAPADEAGEAASDEAGEEAAPADPVWTAAEEAAQARMAEALLFAAAEPLDEAALADRLPEGANIPGLLAALAQHYENRGVNLVKIAGKWRFVTAADVAHVLEKERVEPRRLSRAALETLAIIAYHQPCTRADIEDVRGVAVSRGSLDQLLEIGWARLRGRRRDAPGRPVLYGTTQAFLEHFGLESVADLPGMADLRAAGLLDARLPPGFSVPSPSDAAEGEDDAGDEDDGDAAEFAQDFLAEETPADAEVEADFDVEEGGER